MNTVGAIFYTFAGSSVPSIRAGAAPDTVGRISVRFTVGGVIGTVPSSLHAASLVVDSSWGNATPSFGSQNPTDAHAEVYVQITQAFLVGVTSGAYRYSVDGQVTFTNATITAPACSLFAAGVELALAHGQGQVANPNGHLTFAIVAVATPIMYQVSTDGGATYAAAVSLGSSTSITVHGVTVDLAAGSVAQGDELHFAVTAPLPADADSMTAPTLANVFAGVKTALEAEYGGISVLFGRKEAIKQVNQGTGRANRIVFHEGTPDGDMGGITAPRGIGDEPRALYDLLEPFTVYVWGFDGANRNDEAAQYAIAEAMYCALLRQFRLQFSGWVTDAKRRRRSPDRVERQFGLEFEVICTLRTPVQDALNTTLANLSMTGTVEVLGQQETISSEGTNP